MADKRLFTLSPQGAVRFSIRLTPKGSSNKLGDIVADAKGNLALKASVTAVPENGKANVALIKMLAKAWKLPKSSINIHSGATDRRKILEIDTDHGESLVQRLGDMIKS